MKKQLTAILFAFTLLNFMPAAAQSNTITINGKITSFEESLPLEGASVQVKDSKNVTGSQADGSFTLILSPEEKILVISLPGYEKKEIPITRAREYDIVLKRAGSIVFAHPKKYLVTHKQNEMLK